MCEARARIRDRNCEETIRLGSGGLANTPPLVLVIHLLIKHWYRLCLHIPVRIEGGGGVIPGEGVGQAAEAGHLVVDDSQPNISSGLAHAPQLAPGLALKIEKLHAG